MPRCSSRLITANDKFQSVYVRLASENSLDEFRRALTSNPQLQVKVASLAEFYAEQSTAVTEFITKIGVFIAAMMALGALFGALNTMYSAIAARTREIATLRALGFSSGPVVLSVLLESLVLALIGGAHRRRRRLRRFRRLHRLDHEFPDLQPGHFRLRRHSTAPLARNHLGIRSRLHRRPFPRHSSRPHADRDLD